MPKRVITVVLPVALVALIASCDDDSTGPGNITYTATLSGATEVPVRQSNGTGTWTGVLDPNTNVMTYTLTFTGLTTNSTGAHIHAQSDATTNSNVVLNFQTFAGATTAFAPGATSGSAAGTVNMAGGTVTGLTITGDSLRKAMDAGMAYVNVHSSQFTGGEIRGQIHKQ